MKMENGNQFLSQSKVIDINTEINLEQNDFICWSVTDSKEISNGPVEKSFVLEKGTAQNFTCNRLSQHVNVQWFKVNYCFTLFVETAGLYQINYFNWKNNRKYTAGTVYQKETSSTLSIKGERTEGGDYECRWNNSRGEAKHRKFIVRIAFVKNNNLVTFIIVFAAVLLFVIGAGMSIEFFLEKVSAEKGNSFSDSDVSSILSAHLIIRLS